MFNNYYFNNKFRLNISKLLSNCTFNGVGLVILRESLSNIFITITNFKGEVLFCTSLGILSTSYNKRMKFSYGVRGIFMNNIGKWCRRVGLRLVFFYLTLGVVRYLNYMLKNLKMRKVYILHVIVKQKLNFGKPRRGFKLKRKKGGRGLL